MGSGPERPRVDSGAGMKNRTFEGVDVELNLSAVGMGSASIDGVDVSGVARGITVVAEVSSPTRVTLRFQSRIAADEQLPDLPTHKEVAG